MASSFPGGLDNFTNPSASDTLDSATVPHATQHANANDAIEAIESTLGVNPQGSSATVVARLTALDSTVAGKAPASGIAPSAVTGTAVTQADTGTVTSAMIANATIVSADISGSAGITNAQLANSSVSVNGSSVALGGSVTVTATPTDASVTDAKIATTLSPSKITGTAVVTSDSRLSDTRTPTDASVTDAKIATTLSPSKITGTAVVTADSRLSDTRTPTDASVTDAKIATTLSPSKITGTAVVTSDSRLSDTRTPTDASVTDAKISSTLSATKITGTAAVLAVANAFSVGGHIIANAVTTVIPLLIKRVLNQTADLIQYTMSTGTVLGGRNANGQIWTGNATGVFKTVGGATTAASGDGTTATITTTTATNLAVGDLISTSGITPTGYNAVSVVTAVSNTSPFTVSFANTTTGSQTVAGTVLTPAQTGSVARSLGTLAGAFRAASGATSTSGNILEIQDTGGNALAFFRGDGALQNQVDVRSPSFNSTANRFALLAINSGGMLQLQKATAGSPSGTQDYARLGLIAGTNANTLKLVIAAGNGGAVTTIVDNIPNPA
jgi:hypothetical protein